MSSIGFCLDDKNSDKNEILIPAEFTNALCFGQTGSGKTTGFILPNVDERMKKAGGMLVYAYKDNMQSMIKALALKNGRLGDVCELAAPWSVGINLLKNINEKDAKKWFDSLNSDKNYWHNAAFKLFKSMKKSLFALHELYQKTKDNSLREYENEPSFAMIKYFCQPKRLNALFFNVHEWIELLSHSSKVADENIFILDMLNDSSDELANFVGMEDNETGTGNKGVLETMENLISYAADMPSLNSPEISLESLLDSDKIIIVNVEMMGLEIARLFNICVTSKLISRLNCEHEPKEFTIFIDEAHKILTKDSLPETAVCRESRFEYILSTQNEQLLAKAIGKEEFDATRQNIAYKISFYNPDESSTNSLKTHEFVFLSDSKKSKTKGKAEPIFLSESELDFAQKEYFRLLGIKEQIILEKKLQEIKYIKPLFGNEVLVFLEDGSKVASKAMKTPQKEQIKSKAKEIVKYIKWVKSNR